MTQRSSPAQLAQMHKHSVSASTDMYAVRFSQLFRNSLPERAQKRMVVVEPKGASEEEVVSGRSCSILLCQFLMPQMWTALVNTSSASSIHSAQLLGTYIWATIFLSLEQSLVLPHTHFLRWSFHIPSKNKVQNKDILKVYMKINVYLCILNVSHTHTYALTAQDAYPNLEKVRISPSTF